MNYLEYLPYAAGALAVYLTIITTLLFRKDKNMEKFVNQVLELQKKPIVAIKEGVTDKVTDDKVKTPYKECPLLESPCIKEKCFAYHIDGGRAKCAAMGDIILEQVK